MISEVMTSCLVLFWNRRTHLSSDSRFPIVLNTDSSSDIWCFVFFCLLNNIFYIIFLSLVIQWRHPHVIIYHLFNLSSDVRKSGLSYPPPLWNNWWQSDNKSPEPETLTQWCVTRARAWFCFDSDRDKNRPGPRPPPRPGSLETQSWVGSRGLHRQDEEVPLDDQHEHCRTDPGW